MPGIIDFYDNPNNKLNSDCFTTLRLRNDFKYKIGNDHWVNLKEHNRNINKGLFHCVAVKIIKLNEITPFIAFLEFGLPPDKAKEKMQHYYALINPPINWDEQDLSFVLLLKHKRI